MKICVKRKKSMKIHEINNIYTIYLFWKNKMGYILYSKRIDSSHMCPRKRNKLSKHRKWKVIFRENMHLDMQVTCQSHTVDENLKWSQIHYVHFAPDGFHWNPHRSSVFDKSVGIHFSSKTWIWKTWQMELAEKFWPPDFAVTSVSSREYVCFHSQPQKWQDCIKIDESSLGNIKKNVKS